jgi:hypothetical protein
MLAALLSCLAGMYCTPAPQSASVILKFAVPSTPKHRRAPISASNWAIAPATLNLPSTLAARIVRGSRSVIPMFVQESGDLPL